MTDTEPDTNPPRAWSFGDPLPELFVDHIRRSVPFYDEGHRLVCSMSEFFCRNEGVCYELGVSTGQLMRKLVEHNARLGMRWIGVDKEAAMLRKARQYCEGLENVHFIEADCAALDFEPCNLVVSYYCLQFVSPECRSELLCRIRRALHPGGGLILFEKVRGESAAAENIFSSAYDDFKLRNGFTADEILAKSRSLRGVLSPFTSAQNCAMLHDAGFSTITAVFRYLCFEGLLAVVE